jgi:hypothetical protein
MTVKLEGPLFQGRVAPAIRRAANRAAKSILSDTKELSRVDTGLMRSSWTVTVKSSGSAVNLEISNLVFYAGFQEFGTATIQPMHAATTALALGQDQFASALSAELSTALGGAINVAELSVIGALSNIGLKIR